MATSTSNPKELGTKEPTPFTGNKKKLMTFLLECKLYLRINKNVYDTDELKIAFMLSYMNDNKALKWKEQYLKEIEDKATGNLVFPTFPTFIDEVKKEFWLEESNEIIAITRWYWP